MIRSFTAAPKQLGMPPALHVQRAAFSEPRSSADGIKLILLACPGRTQTCRPKRPALTGLLRAAPWGLPLHPCLPLLPSSLAILAPACPHPPSCLSPLHQALLPLLTLHLPSFHPWGFLRAAVVLHPHPGASTQAVTSGGCRMNGERVCTSMQPCITWRLSKL